MLAKRIFLSSTERWATPFAVLALLIGAEWSQLGPGPAAIPPGPRPTSPAPRAVNRKPSPDPASLAQLLLARPLFEPDRRPSSPGLSASFPDRLPPPRLTGTIVVGRSQRSAILVPPGSERSLIMHEGERASGVTVLRIMPGSIDALGPEGPFTLQVSFSVAATETVQSAAWEAETPVNPRNRGTTDQDE